MELLSRGTVLLFPILLMQSPFPAYAESMRCKLIEVLQLAENGSFEASLLEAHYLKNDLVVDMTTGVVYHGQGFGNESYPIKTILDTGSPSSSFKLISSSVPRRISEDTTFANTVYLQIDIYKDGDEKPFLVVESNNVGTGICK